MGDRADRRRAPLPEGYEYQSEPSRGWERRRDRDYEDWEDQPRGKRERERERTPPPPPTAPFAMDDMRRLLREDRESLLKEFDTRITANVAPLATRLEAVETRLNKIESEKDGILGEMKTIVTELNNTVSQHQDVPQAKITTIVDQKISTARVNAPGPRSTNPCDETEEAKLAVRDLLELRFGVVVPEANATEVVNEVLQQVGTTLDDEGAKIVKVLKPGRYRQGSTVVLRFSGGPPDRTACRDQLSEKNEQGKYTDKTQHGDAAVTAWIPRPSYETARSAKLFQARELLASTKGLIKTDISLDWATRTLVHNGTVLARQSIADWRVKFCD
jgi:hypothetical protein